MKDVQFVTFAGDEPVRVEILKKGLVDAICTVPPGPVRLAREGYNVLIWYPVFVKERNVDDLAGVLIAEVRWPATGANQKMRGCGVVAVGVAADMLSQMQSSLVELAAALSGSLRLRDQRT